MGVYHDLAEYSEEDYAPGQISLEEKHQRERAVIELLRDKLWRGQEIYDIWVEFEEGATLEAILMVQLDKLDAAIQALEYEKQWFERVVDFYPYAQARLTHPVLKNTFEILLRKNFPEVDFYEQYFLLLELQGDEERFYQEMYRQIFRAEELRFAEVEIKKAFESRNDEFFMAYNIIYLGLKGENITLDNVTHTLWPDLPDNGKELFDQAIADIEFYRLNFNNAFWSNIEQKCSVIIKNAKKSWSITHEQSMKLRFLFSWEALLPFSEIPEETILFRQSWSPHLFVDKNTLLQWTIIGWGKSAQ